MLKKLQPTWSNQNEAVVRMIDYKREIAGCARNLASRRGKAFDNPPDR